MVGFRKTSPAENYEMVANLGNITNFLSAPPGTPIPINNYTRQQLTNMCPDNLGKLLWNVWATFGVSGQPLTNAFGSFPIKSCWYTVPRTNVNVQTTPVNRFPFSNAGTVQQQMLGAQSGANTVSVELGATNVYNYAQVVLEPSSFDPGNNLTTYIGDSSNPSYGDWGGATFSTFTVENTTPSSFTTPSVSDFYLNVPTSGNLLVDPLTGSTTGKADYLGYFTLNTDGTMTFTRASASGAPAAGSVTSLTGTNGFAPLQVVFTNTATGNITNWIWNFGNGTIITNITGGNVTNTYSSASGGTYTVTLTVNGPGGSSTNIMSNYIVASPPAKLGAVTFSTGKLQFNGTNGPAGVQYRILSSTNITLAVINWIPIFTNTIQSDGRYGYTNNLMTNVAAYYRLVSP